MAVEQAKLEIQERSLCSFIFYGPNTIKKISSWISNLKFQFEIFVGGVVHLDLDHPRELVADRLVVALASQRHLQWRANIDRSVDVTQRQFFGHKSVTFEVASPGKGNALKMFLFKIQMERSVYPYTR